MQITAGLEIIKYGWVQKPKGFRVQYQKRAEGDLVTELSPPEGSALLDSDVVAWRYAWKLSMATRSDGDDLGPDELVNIHVVNDEGEKVIYYATGEYTVFNEKTAE